jgi:hypothetical protein
MNLTGLYCLVLYLTFFFDMLLFVDNYLNSSNNAFNVINKKRSRYKNFVSLSDDLYDVFVDDEEFYEFL